MSTHTFIGGTSHYALSSYLFPFLKVSSLTYVVQTMVFQNKTAESLCFKKHTVWLSNFPNRFKFEVQSHIAKIIKHLTW